MTMQEQTYQFNIARPTFFRLLQLAYKELQNTIHLAKHGFHNHASITQLGSRNTIIQSLQPNWMQKIHNEIECSLSKALGFSL